MSTKGRIAAIREAWERGTLEIELERGGFSIYEKQSILAVTSDGRRAGKLPRGHHDDSRGRFRVESEDVAEGPRVIRWRPDEAVTPEEQATINAVARLRSEGHTGEAVYDLASVELGMRPRQVRSRIESGNRKITLRAQRLAEELKAAADGDDDEA